MTSQRLIRTYYAITGLFNLAMSLIWGIDTLFKLHAGLDIFQGREIVAARCDVGERECAVGRRADGLDPA